MTTYIAYWNNESEVIPLKTVENYSDADKNFDIIAKEFVKVFYAESDRNWLLGAPGKPEPFHPIKICKYEDRINDSLVLVTSILKGDTTFPNGVFFVKKKHEACIYEKICHVGSVYNSYTIKNLGRIGVLMQDLPLHALALAELKYKHDVLQDKLTVEERKVSNLEAEVKRLEYTNAILERSLTEKSTNSVTHTPIAKAAPSSIGSSPAKKFADPALLAEIKTRFENGNLFPKRKASLSKETDAHKELDKLIEEIDNFRGELSFMTSPKTKTE